MAGCFLAKLPIVDQLWQGVFKWANCDPIVTKVSKCANCDPIVISVSKCANCGPGVLLQEARPSVLTIGETIKLPQDCEA